MENFICSTCELKEPKKYNPKGKEAKKIAQRFEENRKHMVLIKNTKLY